MQSYIIFFNKKIKLPQVSCLLKSRQADGTRVDEVDKVDMPSLIIGVCMALPTTCFT